MAQPLQYQQVFVPTDFSSVGQLANLYTRDVNSRDQLFDQSVAMQNQLLSELYGQETLDPEVLTQNVDKFANKINQLVTKRGGDYGAAARDIARLGVSELRNPIYGLNKRKVEQVKQLEQALARNPNLLPLLDPRKIALDQVTSPEQLGYSVADPEDIQKAINSIYGDRAKLIRQSSPVKSNDVPGYLESTITRGLTNNELNALLSDPSTLETISNRLPQLKDYLERPDVANWFNSQVQQGMRGLIGGSQKDFLRDYTYDNTGDSTSSSSTTLGTPYYTPPEIKAKIDNSMEQDTKDFEKVIDSKGNLDYTKRNTSLPKEPEEKKDRITYPYYHKSYQSTGGEIHRRGFDVFDELKENYSALYKSYKDKGRSDKDFYTTATQLKRNQAYTAETNLRLNNVNFTDNISRMTDNIGKMFINSKNKEVSFKDYNDKFGDTGLNPGDLSAQITPRGEIKMQDPKGNLYTVNPKYLSASLKHYTGILNKMYNDFYNYKVSSNDVENINNSVIPLDNMGNYIGTYIDPDEPLQRSIVIYKVSQTGELMPYAQMNNFTDLHNNILNFIDEDLNLTRRNPKAINE